MQVIIQGKDDAAAMFLVNENGVIKQGVAKTRSRSRSRSFGLKPGAGIGVSLFYINI